MTTTDIRDAMKRAATLISEAGRRATCEHDHSGVYINLPMDGGEFYGFWALEIPDGRGGTKGILHGAHTDDSGELVDEIPMDYRDGITLDDPADIAAAILAGVDVYRAGRAR